MATQYSNRKIVTNGLIFCVDAADGNSYTSGSTSWLDLSNSGNTGTLTNGPTFSSANRGGILFDGSNDYVNVESSSIFNVQNFTLSTWVKFSSFKTYNALITNPQTGTISVPWTNPYLSWMLRVDNNNIIEVAIGYVSSYSSNNFSYSFSTNTNYNIVATYNGAFLSAYVNSSLINQLPVTGTINYTSKPVVLGTDYGQSFSNCTMYLAQIYNRALTASEVQQNFNAQRTRFGI